MNVFLFFLQRKQSSSGCSDLAPLFVLHDWWVWIIHGKSHSYIALSWSKRLTSLRRLECWSDYYASPTFMWKHLVTMMSVAQTIQRVFVVSPGCETTICINLWAWAAQSTAWLQNAQPLDATCTSKVHGHLFPNCLMHQDIAVVVQCWQVHRACCRWTPKRLQQIANNIGIYECKVEYIMRYKQYTVYHILQHYNVIIHS